MRADRNGMRDVLDQAGVLPDCKKIAIDFESQDIVKPPRGSVGADDLSSGATVYRDGCPGHIGAEVRR